MNNLLGGIVPEIVRPAPKAKRLNKQKVKKVVLYYDRRHDNKRDFAWMVRKTGFRLKSWMEMLGDL